LAYDLLVRAAELPAAAETVRRHPDVRFVLDHVAKPPLRSGVLGPWADGVAALAELPNVTCKLSGLFTEAEPGAALVPTVAAVVRRACAGRAVRGRVAVSDPSEDDAAFDLAGDPVGPGVGRVRIVGRVDDQGRRDATNVQPMPRIGRLERPADTPQQRPGL